MGTVSKQIIQFIKTNRHINTQFIKSLQSLQIPFEGGWGYASVSKELASEAGRYGFEPLK